MAKIKRRKQRTQKEKDADFVMTTELMRQNKTWKEVEKIIQEEREYFVSLYMLRVEYLKKVKAANVAVSAEMEKGRLLDDLISLMNDLIEAYQKSKGVKIEKVTDTGKNVKIVLKEIVSYGDTRYINAYSKLLDQYTKLAGLDEEKTNVTVENYIIADNGSWGSSSPITSEDDAKDTALDI